MRSVYLIGSVFATLAFALLASCSSVPTLKVDSRWADYQSWTKLTQEGPVIGDPTGYLGEMHLGQKGHKEIYVNDIGEEVILSDGPYNYPVGTVIVKEQFASREDWLARRKPEVTVSIKFKDSRDSANWQWASGYRARATDNLLCSGCHSHAVMDDFVFSNNRFLNSLQQ